MRFPCARANTTFCLLIYTGFFLDQNSNKIVCSASLNVRINFLKKCYSWAVFLYFTVAE